MDHPFKQEIKAAKALAKLAGEVVKKLKAGSSYSFKDDNEGPVSEGDLKADQLITERLSRQFPEDLIISEEGCKPDSELPQKGKVWLIDPIDGTNDYVRGGLDYSVMIGLLVDGKPTLGVVFAPETGELWTGVYLDDAKRFAQHEDQNGLIKDLDISSESEISNDPIITVSKSHPSKVADKIAASLKPLQIIKKGSIGLKIGLIAESKADLYVAASLRIKVWDTCAPFAILKAAGGKVFTFDGSQPVFGPSCTHTQPFFAVSYRFANKAIKTITKNY